MPPHLPRSALFLARAAVRRPKVQDDLLCHSAESRCVRGTRWGRALLNVRVASFSESGAVYAATASVDVPSFPPSRKPFDGKYACVCVCRVTCADHLRRHAASSCYAVGVPAVLVWLRKRAAHSPAPSPWSCVFGLPLSASLPPSTSHLVCSMSVQVACADGDGAGFGPRRLAPAFATLRYAGLWRRVL